MKKLSNALLVVLCFHIIIVACSVWIYYLSTKPEYKFAFTETVQSYTIETKWAEGYKGKHASGERAYFKLKSVEQPYRYLTLRVTWPDWVEHEKGDRVAYKLTNSAHGLSDVEHVGGYYIKLMAGYILGMLLIFMVHAIIESNRECE